MGSELLRIAEGFSIVAEGLRGLAKAEGGSKTAEKDTGKTQKQDTVNRFILKLLLQSCRRRAGEPPLGGGCGKRAGGACEAGMCRSGGADRAAAGLLRLCAGGIRDG